MHEHAFAWIADRGREGRQSRYLEQAARSGAPVVRINTNENPVGPGQHVIDAIVGKFPEAARYPKTHTRISIGTMAEMQRAIQTFERVLAARTAAA